MNSDWHSVMELSTEPIAAYRLALRERGGFFLNEKQLRVSGDTTKIYNSF